MAQDAALDAAAEMLGVGKDVLAHSLTHKKARWGGDCLRFCVRAYVVCSCAPRLGCLCESLSDSLSRRQG